MKQSEGVDKMGVKTWHELDSLRVYTMEALMEVYNLEEFIVLKRNRPDGAYTGYMTVSSPNELHFGVGHVIWSPGEMRVLDKDFSEMEKEAYYDMINEKLDATEKDGGLKWVSLDPDKEIVERRNFHVANLMNEMQQLIGQTELHHLWSGKAGSEIVLEGDLKEPGLKAKTRLMLGG
jgi:hypothetical protein